MNGQGKIFQIEAGQRLSELVETPFEQERLLQEFLATYPDLLPGDQIDPENPRRWLLVDREVSMPGEAYSWWIDHLFVDQDAIPTLVEVKRGANPELRRKVVGQMLDYAASAPLHWSAESLEARFRDRCSKAGIDPAAEFERALGVSVEEFWQRAEQNLKAHRLRLLFVTDRMVPELRRVVEFLNQTMAGVDVLAVELRHYSGSGSRTIVPTVFGLTLATEQKKTDSGQRDAPWTEPEFLAALEQKRGSGSRAIAEAILAWARERKAKLTWGLGRTMGSFFPVFDLGEHRIYPIAVWTGGQIELQLQYLRLHPPFDEPTGREALRERIRADIDFEIPADRVEKRPSFDIDRLAPVAARERFLATLDWIVAQVATAVAAEAPTPLGDEGER